MQVPPFGHYVIIPMILSLELFSTVSYSITFSEHKSQIKQMKDKMYFMWVT